MISKHGPDPADAGLDFVQNQQDAFFVAPPADSLQIALVGDIDAAFSLHRLYHDGTGVFGSGIFNRVDVVEIYIDKADRQWCVRILIMRLPGGGGHGQRPAVE